MRLFLSLCVKVIFQIVLIGVLLMSSSVRAASLDTLGKDESAWEEWEPKEGWHEENGIAQETVYYKDFSSDESNLGYDDDFLRLRLNPSGIARIFEDVLGTWLQDKAVSEWNPFEGQEWAWPGHDDVYVLKTDTFTCPSVVEDPQEVPYLVGLQNVKITLPMAKSPVSVSAKDGYLDAAIDMSGAVVTADVVAYVDGSDCFLVPTLEKSVSIRIEGIHGGIDVFTEDGSDAHRITIDRVENIDLEFDSFELSGDFGLWHELALEFAHGILVGSECDDELECVNGLVGEALSRVDAIPERITSYMQEALDFGLSFHATEVYEGGQMTLSAALEEHAIAADGVYSVWDVGVSTGEKDSCVGEFTQAAYENHDYHDSDAHLSLMLPFSNLTSLLERVLNQGDTCGTDVITVTAREEELKLALHFFPQGDLKVAARYDGESGAENRIYFSIPFEAEVTSSSPKIDVIEESVSIRANFVLGLDLNATCENDLELNYAEGHFDSIQGLLRVTTKSGATVSVPLKNYETRIKRFLQKKILASPLVQMKVAPGLTEFEALGYHLELAKVAVDQSRVQAGIVVQNELKACDWEGSRTFKEQAFR